MHSGGGSEIKTGVHALADCGVHQVPRRRALETALATVYALITGDLAHPPDVIAHALNAWLERNKHLA